jgi:hypothetical protein
LTAVGSWVSWDGGEDLDAVRLRSEVCSLLDKVDTRLARLTGAEEAA